MNGWFRSNILPNNFVSRVDFETSNRASKITTQTIEDMRMTPEQDGTPDMSTRIFFSEYACVTFWNNTSFSFIHQAGNIPSQFFQ